MKIQHNISITALAGVFAVLGLASCEDKAMTAKLRDQRDQIANLEANIEITRMQLGDELPDPTPDLEKAKEELAAVQARAEALRIETTRLQQERDAVEEDFNKYKGDYPIPQQVE